MFKPSFFLLLFFLALHARAASFDCAQARSKAEKLICADSVLSELDDKLQAAYTRAQTGQAEPAALALQQEQRQWLKLEQGRCASAACLRKAYQARVDELDPTADMKITCEEMRRFPSRVFNAEVDLGSGGLSPTEVDYDCPEGLNKQSFMQSMLGSAERIRQGAAEINLECAGTIIHAQWRYYHFGLLEAGFQPLTLKRLDMPTLRGLDWQAFIEAAWPERAQGTLNYFRQWSEQSLANTASYKEFSAVYNRTMPALVAHYEQRLKLDHTRAVDAAARVMWYLVDHTAGAFPRDSLLVESPMLDFARSGLANPKRIRERMQAWSNGPDAEDGSLPYRALAIALIGNHATDEVAAWGEAVTPSQLQAGGEGDEPLLALAIESPQNLKYLLDHKVRVDAENAFGKTALFYAIGAGKVQAVALLLKASADPNHAYKSAFELRPGRDQCDFPGLKHTGRTPLMHAAQHADVAMLKLLLKAGARLADVDEPGYNALDYAVMGQKPENAAYLKSLGLKQAHVD